MRRSQPREGRDDGRLHAVMPFDEHHRAAQRAIVGAEERQDRVQVGRRAAVLAERAQFFGNSGGSPGGALQRHRLPPLAREPRQLGRLSQIPRLAQAPVERGHAVGADMGAACAKRELRGSQEPDQRASREVGGGRVERDVEGRRIGLGCERQGVGQLERQAGRGKHLPGHIDVRERPLEHDRRSRQRLLPLPARLPLDHPRDAGQFLFAIARLPEGRVAAGRPDEVRHDGPGNRRLRHVVVLRQPAPQPIQQSGLERGVRRHHFQPGHAGDACQQVEVGRPQAAGLSRAVGDGDDDV